MVDNLYDNLDRNLYKLSEKTTSYEIQPEQMASGPLLASFDQVLNALKSGKTKFDNSETGYILGLDEGVAKFYIGNTTNYLNWDGTTLTISGSLTATTGAIGGFSIGADYLKDLADSFGLASTVSTASALSSTLSPGTMADDATVGTVAWGTPDNAKVNDGTATSASNDFSDIVSHYLKATNFGFNIPSGATINGIVVEIEERDGANSNAVKDSEVKIVKADGSIGTTNKASASWWTASTSYTTYGANDDLWGESWDSTKINDVDFGVVISTNVGGMFNSSQIDHIRITVYYTTNGDDVRFWAGETFANRATAPFRVTEAGAVAASNLTHSGGTVGGVAVANVAFVSTAVADSVPSGLAISSTAITIAGDGTTSASVVLTWTAVSSDTFDHYLIRYKKASYTYYTYIPSTTNTITIDGLVPNTSYNYGVCSVNKYGTSSAFSSDVTGTTASDTVAPATVTAGSATGGVQYVIVEWTHNTDSDLASYNIYRNTTNNSATATLIGNCRTNYFIDGGRTGGTPLYYWIKAVDTSGNISTNFSTEVHATPRVANAADVNISNRGWTQTCVFSVTDTDTVAWAAGVFTAADGTSYNIDAGNTGNMVARNFIYLDIAVSTTAYQLTTTATSAVGDGKVLIGVAQNNTTEAIF